MQNAHSDFFALFDIPVAFNIDLQDLAQRYRELQRALHPDRHAQSTESERLMSVSRSATLNQAYHTLRDPVARAKYLLLRAGGSWADEQTIQDREFLYAQMELREELEALNQAAAMAALEKFVQRVKALEKKQEALLAQAFAEWQQAHLQTARSEIQKLMFFRKLQAEATDRLAVLEDDNG